MLRPWFEHNNFSGWRLVRLEAWRGVRLEARPQEACPQEGCPLEACPLEGCPLEAEALILPDHQLEECPLEACPPGGVSAWRRVLLEACPPGGLSAGEMTANRIFFVKVKPPYNQTWWYSPVFQLSVEYHMWALLLQKKYIKQSKFSPCRNLTYLNICVGLS